MDEPQLGFEDEEERARAEQEGFEDWDIFQKDEDRPVDLDEDDRLNAADKLRLYEPHEAFVAGYPPEWSVVKDYVREQAGHRCVRCGHPYRKGEHGNGEWSPCDERCDHGMPARDLRHPFVDLSHGVTTGSLVREGDGQRSIEAQWRILTVHHLNGDKHDLRWWNLASLCQRCHLQIQGKVVMGRVWAWEHSEWFQPYAAGWYAWSYLGLDLTREQTLARLDELLALERQA